MKFESTLFHQIPSGLEKMNEAGWVRDMREHYVQHGTFRATDLNRLLGSPINGVPLSHDKEVGLQSLSNFEGHDYK